LRKILTADYTDKRRTADELVPTRVVLDSPALNHLLSRIRRSRQFAPTSRERYDDEQLTASFEQKATKRREFNSWLTWLTSLNSSDFSVPRLPPVPCSLPFSVRGNSLRQFSFLLRDLATSLVNPILKQRKREGAKEAVNDGWRVAGAGQQIRHQ